jgi:outer membrane murein-binding lipoprotein Lpp
MSLIQYQQATYVSHLRDQLELAGCESRVAAIVSRAIGDLIDHVASAQCDLQREITTLDIQRSMRASEVSAAKRESLERIVGTTVFVMTVAIVSGVLIALFR